MSPKVTPPAPGTRWRITITRITPDGEEDTFHELQGQAYIVAAATISANRITTDIDHDGAADDDLALRQRIVARIADTIYDASTR